MLCPGIGLNESVPLISDELGSLYTYHRHGGLWSGALATVGHGGAIVLTPKSVTHSGVTMHKNKTGSAAVYSVFGFVDTGHRLMKAWLYLSPPLPAPSKLGLKLGLFVLQSIPR